VPIVALLQTSARPLFDPADMTLAKIGT